eukprot:3937171-Amphidinium_carterae.2
MPFNTANKKTCKMWSLYAQCRQMGLTFPEKGCHFPWEFHDHFDKGVGWTLFSNTTFAYWEAVCEMPLAALSSSESGLGAAIIEKTGSLDMGG